jgi:hypothetical protein
MIARSTLGGGRWSGGCPSRDIFSMLVAYCSRCYLLRRHIFRNCRLHTGSIRILTASAFIPIGNGRSALFTTPASQPSPLRRSRVRSKAPRRRQQSPLPGRGSRRHLGNCHRLMPIFCKHPIQKSDSRTSNASAKLQDDTRRRLCSWWHGNRDLAGLAIGEQRLSPAHPGT